MEPEHGWKWEGCSCQNDTLYKWGFHRMQCLCVSYDNLTCWSESSGSLVWLHVLIDRFGCFLIAFFKFQMSTTDNTLLVLKTDSWKGRWYTDITPSPLPVKINKAETSLCLNYSNSIVYLFYVSIIKLKGWWVKHAVFQTVLNVFSLNDLMCVCALQIWINGKYIYHHPNDMLFVL